MLRFPKLTPTKRNLASFLVSIFAGILLIFSGTHGPVGLYEALLQELSSLSKDTLILSVATLIAAILIVISSLGGVTVVVGGYLVFKNHTRTGKLVIGLGAGAGIPLFLFLLFTVLTTRQLGPVIAQHSVAGWIGILSAFAARTIAK